MDLSTVNWLSVLVAALVPFVLGGLWYGPLLGRAWMAATGITEEKAREANMPMVFGLSFVMQFLAAAVLDLFIGPDATLSFGLFAGLSVGVFWVGTAFGVVYLFEQRPFRLWAINAGYHIVNFAAMGAILGAW